MPRPRARVVELQRTSATAGVAGARAWLRAARVRQWPKNMLVFAAPAAADALTRPSVLVHVALAFAAFCMLASGVYLINDVHDVAEDRRHPTKQHRPVAAGAIGERTAAIAAAGLLMAGLSMTLLVDWALFATAGGYVLLNGAYTGWLRRVAVADITAIAGAFLLRAVAGGVAAGVSISGWFIVVVSSAALFVAAGKRYCELIDPAASRSRAVLDRYTPGYLRLLAAGACAVALGAYGVWAVEPAHAAGVPWREITIVPFTIVMLRYGVLITRGAASTPEEVLLKDGFTKLLAIAWLVTFGLGV